ncbi:hypothetical protein [Pleionea sp. CnH1-48]|uniref:hypothetical protein n=1 Tax=Pleionea sp. CnH1-48 TaxID=2954494 RepID=UPI002097DA2E|nr:hypothetical protein [Pleionea sp. CnH1-48]MCO7223032.1 hypothetical protein [Pleionea sp. CnH1-48]
MWDAIKDTAQLFYHISGVGLLLLGIYAARQVLHSAGQLSVSKQKLAVLKKQLEVNESNIKLQEKDLALRKEELDRSAKVSASEVVSSYMNDFLPNANKVCMEWEKQGLSNYEGTVNKDFFHGNLKQNEIQMATDKFNTDGFIASMNMLESISAQVILGVADSDTAFHSIGRSFCHEVSVSYDALCLIRKYRRFNHWGNIVSLYNTWTEALNAEEENNDDSSQPIE